MRNIKLLIEYQGTNYDGWQAQKRTSKTIQQVLEKTLSQILQEKIKLIAAGRTDAGVHSIGQVANFKTNSKLSLDKIQRALNGLLPEDITILNVEEASLNFHSRYDAKSKMYRYVILQGLSRLSINRDFFWYVSYKLDIRRMRGAAKLLIGKHNFSAFCASGSNVKNKVRTIKNISIKTAHNNFLSALPKWYHFLVIDIEADGFLYNMVRNIVGTLVEIGRCRFNPAEIKFILASKNRKNAGPTAPAGGLTLFKINYVT